MERLASRGIATSTILVVLIVLAVATAAAVLLRVSAGDEGEAATPDTFVVRRGEFDVTVPASGELAALRQTEIASRLEARAVITEIVDEGVLVEEGDVLVRLDEEEIRDRMKDAEDAVNTTDNAWVTATSNLEIRRQSNASELQQADVAVRLAELALRAWAEGEDVSQRETLRLEVETTKKDYDRLVDRFEDSARLLEQEYISEDEYRQDEIEMIRARSRHEQAKLAEQVYTIYLSEQQRELLESELKQAKDKRTEIEQRHATEITSLESDVASKAYHLESQQERLAKLHRQLDMCTILAPQDGLVVYASSLDSGGWRRNDDQPPTVGTELRRNETVMILPDTSKMVAEVKVNEAKSGKIKKGQRAVVYSDALPSTPLAGEVLSVGVLAESGGWRDPNRRDYTVRIMLADIDQHKLKPSMRCKAEIYVARVEEALFVPVQAVHLTGATAFAYVTNGSGIVRRPVDLGRSSELYIEIRDGLDEGEAVLLRDPPAGQVVEGA